ncbi:MAG TPA: leucine-rich repeat domain-containing protein, partial [Saprospiraceae bacterium]|nr:leucine-rich repeat domain-containing protein [Saprospiraceae bacterium]
MTQLTVLRDLNMAGNKLSTWPQQINALPALQFVFWGGNPIPKTAIEQARKATPAQLMYQPGQPNPISREDLLAKIQAAANDTILNLSDLLIDELPEAIGTLHHLTELNLSSNQLSRLPQSFAQLKNLRRLTLADNYFGEWPAQLSALDQLQSLNLRSNYLSQIPPDVLKMKALNDLDISLNRLRVWPDELKKMERLKRLCISPDLWNLGVPTALQRKGLQILTPAGIRDEALDVRLRRETLSPEEQALLLIKAARNSQTLGLSLGLTQLPAEIGSLSHLTELYLYGNQLTSLPPEIGQLSELTLLNLDGNQFTELPESLSQLQYLRTLSLHRNPLPAAEVEKIRRALPNCIVLFAE